MKQILDKETITDLSHFTSWNEEIRTRWEGFFVVFFSKKKIQKKKKKLKPYNQNGQFTQHENSWKD